MKLLKCFSEPVLSNLLWYGNISLILHAVDFSYKSFIWFIVDEDIGKARWSIRAHRNCKYSYDSVSTLNMQY